MEEGKPYETPTTVDSVRDWVVGGGPADSGRSQYTVLLNVEHSNLKVTRLSELRMDLRSTVDDVKQRLYLHTGTRPASMHIFLRSCSGSAQVELRDVDATLSQCGIVTGDSLLLVDDDPFSVSANGWLEDTSLVPMYKLTDEAYDKKENTYRKFKQKMREKDPKWSMTSSLAKQVNATQKGRGADVADNPPKIQKGDRIEVFPGAKRGEVRFVGRDLHELPPGWWVGIRYDEPVGKNDGIIKGVRYFHAEMNFGGLARPSNVTVGDFPALDVESDDEL